MKVWLVVPHPEAGVELEVVGDMFHCLACGAKHGLAAMGDDVLLLPIIQVRVQP
jgi:hypothetical protein